MLDTNIVSHLLKAHPHVVARVTAAPMDSLCISSVTEGELQFGVAKRPEARALRIAVGELLRRLDVLSWTSATARRYGLVRAHLQRLGLVLAPLDLLIAAHALESGAVLVTNDQAFGGLEDWTMP